MEKMLINTFRDANHNNKWLSQLPPEMEPGVKLDTEFFKYNASYAKVPFFLNCREVTTRFRFPAGYYVIVASTFEPEMTGEFLLRIFTEAKRLKSSAN